MLKDKTQAENASGGIDFQTIFKHSPISYQVFSLDGMTIMVNKAWENLWHIPSKKIVGHYNILHDKQFMEKKLMKYIQKAFKGETVLIPLIKYEPSKTSPGNLNFPLKWIKATMYPVKNKNGKITHLVMQHDDITLQKAQEENEKLLNDINKVLGESIEYKTTIQNIGRVLVPSFADYVRIVLVNEKKQVQDLAVFHRDTEKVPLVKKLYEKYKNKTENIYGVTHILKTGKPEIMALVKGEEVSKSTQSIKKTIAQLHLTSYMGVPLKLRKKIIGVITFSSIRKEKIYSRKDLELAKEIALRISYTIENSLLFKSIKQELEEKEKSQSEQTRLAVMLDQTFDAIVLWKWKDGIVYWNKGAEELYGYSKKEAIGKKTHALLKTVHSVHFSEIEKILLKTGRWEGELQHTTKSKKKLIISSKKILVRQNNEKMYILETNRDITRQKNAQLVQARFAAIINSSEDAIISKNLNSIITTWNHAAEKMFGYKAEEIIGKPIYLIIPSDRFSEEAKIIAKLREAKRIKHLQTVRIAKNGRKINVSLTISPILDEKGQVIGASKIARDITQQIRLQSNLRFFSTASKLLSSSLDYKQTLQNVAKLAVPRIADWCAIDMKTETGIEQLAVVHINPEKVKWAKELNRKNPPNPHGKTGVPNVLRTGKSEFVPHITDKMLVQAVKNKAQLDLLRKLQLSSVMIIPIQFGKKVLGALSFVSAESNHHYTKADLTIAEELAARAGIAIENAKLYSEAQSSINLRDDFISLASHELKTPITSLKMYAQALLRQYSKSGNEDFSQYVKKMEQQTDKLTLLVNDLLNASKTQHGKLDFSMDYIDLNLIVKETVDMLQKTVQKHKIFIEGKINKKVYADQYRIYQVLTNILSNGIKYSPAADKIIVKLTSEKNFAVVTIQDFGIGIEHNQQKKIFSPFYRGVSSDEKTFPGLGMGLYISSEIIKRHGGTINVFSEKDKGSQFSFTLAYNNLQKRKKSRYDTRI